MSWVQIGSALFLVAMMAFIFPRMRAASKNAPKGSNKDWMGFVMIVVAVGVFVMFLIKMV